MCRDAGVIEVGVDQNWNRSPDLRISFSKIGKDGRIPMDFARAGEFASV